MSKTDVHRPWTVQVTDPYNRHLLYRYPAWPWQTELTSFRNLGCGCGLCTQQAWRKRARRADRQSIRRDLRAAVSHWAAGELDEDGPAPRRWDSW